MFCKGFIYLNILNISSVEGHAKIAIEKSKAIKAYGGNLNAETAVISLGVEVCKLFRGCVSPQ